MRYAAKCRSNRAAKEATMIANNSNEVVDALVEAEIEAERTHSERRSRRDTVTVTVARDCGAGGATIAFLLAKHLGLRCYDRDLLGAVARDAHTERRLMERLDEHPSNAMDDWSYSMIWGQGAMREDYKLHLKNVVHRIAKMSGSVILGRGVNFLLDESQAFRVRIAGSPERCAGRLSAERRISVEEALKIVNATNEERAKDRETVSARSGR
jgi:hypothetical protein